MSLLPHHRTSIERFVKQYRADETVIAILLGGSIAHGYSTAESDIDILLVLTSEAYLKRKQESKLTFSIRDLCDYPGGYIDCKVIDVSFLEIVAEKGSDPARFAFKDATVLCSKKKGLEELLQRIQRYPVHQMEERRLRFASQMLAWKWYYNEGCKKENAYLKGLGVHKFVFFACRLVLNENQLLYPFHKWMLRVVESASHAPPGFSLRLSQLMTESDLETIETLCDEVLEFYNIDENSLRWAEVFLKDSEQNWIEHEAPIDDI